MFINSALNEGLAGMQQSQKKMLQAAQDIVKAGLPTDQNSRARQGSEVPVSEAGTSASDIPGNSQVEATTRSSELGSKPEQGVGDLVEPLIEQKVQQQLFNASASVVQVASENLGTLIDDLS